MIRVLGIDPGTIRTGWGVIEVENRNINLVDSGVFRPKMRDRIQKLLEIHKFFLKLIQDKSPDIVAVENTFYGKNIQSMIKLGEARSSAILAAALSDKDVATFAPREIKMAVVGNGNASKEQVAFMVKRLIGAPEDCPFDETDALAVAYCWAQRSLRAS